MPKHIHTDFNIHPSHSLCQNTDDLNCIDCYGTTYHPSSLTGPCPENPYTPRGDQGPHGSPAPDPDPEWGGVSTSGSFNPSAHFYGQLAQARRNTAARREVAASLGMALYEYAHDQEQAERWEDAAEEQDFETLHNDRCQGYVNPWLASDEDCRRVREANCSECAALALGFPPSLEGKCNCFTTRDEQLAADFLAAGGHPDNVATYVRMQRDNDNYEAGQRILAEAHRSLTPFESDLS